MVIATLEPACAGSSGRGTDRCARARAAYSSTAADRVSIDSRDEYLSPGHNPAAAESSKRLAARDYPAPRAARPAGRFSAYDAMGAAPRARGEPIWAAARPRRRRAVARPDR